MQTRPTDLLMLENYPLLPCAVTATGNNAVATAHQMQPAATCKTAAICSINKLQQQPTDTAPATAMAAAAAVGLQDQ